MPPKRSCSASSRRPGASRSPHRARAGTACSRGSAPRLASRVGGGPGPRAALAAIAVRAAAAAQVFVDDPAHPVLSSDDAHHLGRVLRLRAGEEVIVSDGVGHWARTRWTDAGGGGGDGSEALAMLGDGPGLGGDGSVQFEQAPLPTLTVAFAPTKGERPEWVVQKLTELGIDRVVPLVSERSVVRWSGARGQGAVARLRRGAREAAGSGCPRSARSWPSTRSGGWGRRGKSGWPS